MKHSAEHTRALNQLLSRLSRTGPKDPPPPRNPIEQLIFAFMAWEATHARAQGAYERLMKHAVDLNDVRVSDPSETVAVIGPSYPRAAERAQRLRQVLNAIYRREHAVDLSSLASKTKKEVHQYLDTLEGMVPYVSAAVTLLSFEGHAVPLDEQLRRRLADDGIVEPSATLQETQAFLEHHIRFEDAISAHQRLRAYVDSAPKVSLDGKKRPAAKTRKTTKTRR